MGRLLPGFAARVVDDYDNQVPDGEAGELMLRADEPFAFATGYFGMPEKTVEAWRNLWFHTGDRVIREPDGYYRFVDRMKDAIRRRGENISSYEVEQVLISHPAVANAAVFPVRSELAEDEVMAAIVLRAGADLEPAALLDYCQPLMPYFAVPALRRICRDAAGDREWQGDEISSCASAASPLRPGTGRKPDTKSFVQGSVSIAARAKDQIGGEKNGTTWFGGCGAHWLDSAGS